MFRQRGTRYCAAVLLLLVAIVSAQTIVPSNNSADIPPYDSSPRFWVNGSDFDHFRIVPLGWYARISQGNFIGTELTGNLALIDPSNANDPPDNGVVYVSCDPEDYTGELGAADIVRTVASVEPEVAVVLFSTRANHCDASGLRSLTVSMNGPNGVFSTLDPVLAATVADQIRGNSTGVPAVVSADPDSYRNSGGGSYSGNSSERSSGPTTAVAMIILYTITGLITALFIVIIVTGAIRAHRHPERYGPNNAAGRARRSRAKGIARAMLDTIPIVKFGEKDDAAKKAAGDVELATVTAESAKAAEATGTDDKDKSVKVAESDKGESSNADGTDESGHLGCSICTEDFSKGEEVRVLPCNHKFHPECVDPWLLNVSGTCPLCRIDLRPQDEQNPAEDGDAAASRRGSVVDGTNAPPLGGRRVSHAGRRDTVAFAGLLSVASASREDRIAALRRYRQQRRSRAGLAETSDQQDEERRGVSTRLRERFRVRTRRQGEDTIEEARP